MTLLAAAPRGKGGALLDRDNGITAGRLVLALMVLTSHSFSLTGFNEPLVLETGQVSLGLIAVYGFFGLSGYLLTRSREQTPSLPFLWNRALRILPGYWVALVFGAVAATVATWLVGRQLSSTDAIGYVVSNLALIPGVQTLPPAFHGADVNGSLWTLGIEAVCYLILAITPRRLLKGFAIGLVPALMLVGTTRHSFEIQLGLAFLAGSCAYQLRLPITWQGTILASLLAGAGYALHLEPLATLAVAFAGLGLARLPIRIERDLSYGIYVFAFPVAGLLELTVLPTLGVGAMIAGTVALVLPMAWLSWTLLESRELRLRWSPVEGTGSFRRRARRGPTRLAPAPTEPQPAMTT
jgi:peptidoglycan/LPS O-acetylase OafA/YrhL